MATKKEKDKKEKTEKDLQKEEKRKARMEKLKNMPEGQRTNSKQFDVIDLGNGNTVKNFGYPVKNKDGHIGIVVTSVLEAKETPVSTSVTFIPGKLTIKTKKGHGSLVNPKNKKKGKKEKEEVEEGSED